jgi:hypothetical protein
VKRWFWIGLQLSVFVLVWWQIAPPHERMMMQRTAISAEEGKFLQERMATALFLAALSTYAFATLCLYVPIWAGWLLRRTARKN